MAQAITLFSFVAYLNVFSMSDPICPLCSTPHASFYHQDQRRVYHQCHCCKLVFVAPAYLPSAQAEQAEYQLHENHPDDTGYRQFLNRAAAPLCAKLGQPATGLDFGCGPAPVLAAMLEAAGHTMHLYDPFFHPDTKALERQYQFITCTEAIEHFHAPVLELNRLDACLETHGWLCVMTKRVISAARFKNWHYKNDPTHVSFFSDETFYYIGRKYGYQVYLVSADVVLMHKQSYTTPL